MKRPKNCNGCKAYYQNMWRFSCDLGYELKSKKVGSVHGVDILTHSPLGGQCPKPRTLRELCDATKKGGVQ